MPTYFVPFRLAVAALLLTGLPSCQDKVEPAATPKLRMSIDYATLKDTTTYATAFVDNNKANTVDLTTGSTRLLMFWAINTYNGTAVGNGATLDANVLKNMFANTGSPFSGTVNTGLNTSGIQLRSVTASSGADAEKERQTIEAGFTAIAAASKSVTATAGEGKAGKLGTYLVDEKGIEWGQIIQKGLIGAFQLDYMGNVLLSDKNLSVDNTSLVAGKNYTPLEQNWDEIYSILTANPVYGSKATATSSGESFIGSYIWEYNKAGFAKIHPEFLMGRAAVVNNDRATLKAQATLLRTELEKTVANAALGYLGKWKTGTTDAVRAHAIGEGMGFIYGLRYAKLNNADAAFSDNILANLIYSSPNGFWGLTNAKIDAAVNAIKIKFNIPN